MEIGQSHRRVDRGRLSEIGRRRLDKGLLCFAYFDGRCFEAVNLDFGLHVRARSYDEARAELNGVLREFLDLAMANGHLEEILSRPMNDAAYANYKRINLVYRIASVASWPLRTLLRISSALFAPVEQYEDAGPLSFA